MVRYAERFLDRLSEENHPLAFGESKRAAFIMSVWLHDVGKLVETEKDGKGGYRKSRAGKCLRHPISGTALAHEAGIRDEAVLNTIACHAKEGEGAPKCLETILIHQADFATFDPLVMMEKGNLIA